jgi:alpha-tubulin suppressor-like RCC1 family protein
MEAIHRMKSLLRACLPDSRKAVGFAFALSAAGFALSSSMLFSACGAPSAKNPKRSTLPSPRAVGIGDLTNVTDLSTGSKHTCAIASGGVYCMGMNTSGQLGDGTSADRGNPYGTIAEGSGATQVSAGGSHTCAVVSGALKCWGENDDGQLGTGDSTDHSTPVTITVPGTIVQVAAGTAHTCALNSVGAVYCWGANTFGQLGDANMPTANPVPSAVGAPMNANVEEIAVGANHSCGRLNTGAVWCWGAGTLGQLGDGTHTHSDVPLQATVVTADPGAGVRSIAAGSTHTCAVQNGGVKCWGDNFYGQLAEATFTQQDNAYASIAALSGATQVSCGAFHTCATVSGGIKCFGNNANDELNNGAGSFTATPVDSIAASSSATVAAAGGQHTCAIVNSVIRCWGSNSNGQRGN